MSTDVSLLGGFQSQIDSVRKFIGTGNSTRHSSEGERGKRNLTTMDMVFDKVESDERHVRDQSELVCEMRSGMELRIDQYDPVFARNDRHDSPPLVLGNC